MIGWRHVSKKWWRFHFLIVYFISLSCFRNKKSVQFLLFVAFVSLRTNVRLCALSAVIHAYLCLEKMVYFRELKMNHIFKTQHHMAMILTENILLKIRIIFIQKMGIRLNSHENMFWPISQFTKTTKNVHFSDRLTYDDWNQFSG